MIEIVVAVFLFLLGSGALAVLIYATTHPPDKPPSAFQLEVEADARKRETMRKMNEYNQRRER